MGKPINAFVGQLIKKKESAENVQSVEDDVIHNEEDYNTPSIQRKQPKGDKDLAFIQNCVISYQNSEFSNTEKCTLNINRGINTKLKMMAIGSNVTVSELANSIINNYFEINKKEISALMKKMQK